MGEGDAGLAEDCWGDRCGSRLIGGLVVWSHGQLRTDIRQLSSDMADVRERLARIEGHLAIQPRPAQ